MWLYATTLEATVLQFIALGKEDNRIEKED